MPQFYFDYRHHCGRLETDDEGIDLPDLNAAYLAAYHAAIDMWAEARHEGRDLSRHRFEIRSAQPGVLLELPFAEVLGVSG